MFDRTGVIADRSDLDLDPMTFIYKLKTRIAWRYAACANMNLTPHPFESYRLTDIQTDRHDQN